MKKRIMTVLLSALLLLSGCGGGGEKSAYTAEDVTALLDAGAFSGEMEQVVFEKKWLTGGESVIRVVAEEEAQ